MSPPGYFLCAGVLSLLLGDSVSALPSFASWLLVVVMSVSFPVTSFLSLRAFILRIGNRRRLLAYHLAGQAGFLFLVACWAARPVMFLSTFGVVASVSMMQPSPLVTYAELAKDGPTEALRHGAAEGAYETQGVSLAYRQDGGKFAYYEPTEKARKVREHFEKSNATITHLQESISPFVDRIASLLICVLGGYFLVYLAGGVWLYSEIPENEV